MRFGAAQSETAERAHALRHRALVELLPSVMAVVERRRLAGTLLYGKIAPHEVEWHRQHHAPAGKCDATMAGLLAQFVGYETYLRVARLAMSWLFTGHKFSLPTPAQMQQNISCAATALDLMSAPRLRENETFNFEAALLNEVCHLLKDEATISREHRDVLSDALGRLADSGVVEQRDLRGAVRDMLQWSQDVEAKAQAEKEAPRLQSCAHCGAREVHVAQFKRCSACKCPRFCSKECQLANWPAHKAACKAARKAAAGAAPSA